MVEKDVFYPVMDRIPFDQREKLGLKFGLPLKSLGVPVGKVHARWTGEKRKPKKGEWYLSGEPTDAYIALKDMDEEYHIAELVRTKTKTVIVEDK